MATVFGTEGDDAIKGDQNGITIAGQGGNDTLNTQNGSATFFGGFGNDTLFGGNNNDTLQGDGGDDSIEGGNGQDVLIGDGGANLLTNGSFEVDGNPDASKVDTAIKGWTSSSGTSEVWSSGFLDTNSVDGGDFVELDQKNNSLDTISQSVETVEGESYVLSFDAQTRDHDRAEGDSIEVYWRGELIDTVTPDADGWTTYTYTVTGSGGSDELTFSEVEGEENSFGVLLDNASLIAGGNDTIDGGDGDDDIFGGAGDDVFVIQNDGSNFNHIAIAGGEDGPDDGIPDGDVYTIDLSEFFEADSGTQIIYENGQEGDEDRTIRLVGSNGQEYGRITFTNIEEIRTDPICFTPGTRIVTAKGEVPVEALQEGDRVFTRDNGVQDVHWVGQRHLDAEDMIGAPHFEPILIRAGHWARACLKSTCCSRPITAC